MNYSVHENETGSFQELARQNDVIFGQLSYLTIRPGCTRGNHYHTRKEEWFCCISGRCELVMQHIHNNTQRTVVLESDKKQFAKVNPYENHWVTNQDKDTDCELIIIISEEYNPEDPDTFRL